MGAIHFGELKENKIAIFNSLNNYQIGSCLSKKKGFFFGVDGKDYKMFGEIDLILRCYSFHSLVFLDSLLKSILVCSAKLVNKFSILEELEGWNSADILVVWERLQFVYINMDEDDISVLLAQLLVNWSNHLAWPTPFIEEFLEREYELKSKKY